MKIYRKFIIFIISLILIISLGAFATFSWIGTSSNTITTKISGKIVQEYFHSGIGTEDDPFRITRPIHYYHLVEFFQRETELEMTDAQEQAVNQLFGHEYIFFELGAYDMDRDGVDDFETPMVYAYDDSGDLILDENGDPTFTDVLNMSYYSGDNSLLPIGSSEVPFVGAFIGNNLTVINLSIVSSETVTIARKDENGHYVYSQKDRSTSDIGIFGCVEADSGAANIYFENVTISLVDTDPTATSEDVSMHTAHDEVCAGYLAGHISIQSAFVNVYINNCTITGGNAAITSFGYFGRVDDENGTQITSLDQTLSEMYTSGEDAGFGGSIDMHAMYTRVITAYDNAKEVTTVYPRREIVFLDDEDHEISRFVVGTSTMTDYVWNNSVDNSSFFMFKDSRTDSSSTANSFIYISGMNGAHTKDVTTYKYITANAISDNVYLIHSDNNYLSLKNDSNAYAVRNTSSSDATKWIYDPSTHYIYTYVPNYNAAEGQDDKLLYYLNRNGTNVTISTTASTTWTLGVVDGQDEIYTTSGNSNYYLVFNDGWIVTSDDVPYVISDGNGNYLVASLNNMSTATTAKSATKWAVTNLTGNTQFYTSIDNTRYYLGINNGLALVETATTWIKDNNSYYCDYNNARYYLTYDEGWKIVCYDGYLLGIDDNYLSISSSLRSVTNNSEDEAKRRWQLSNPTGATTIYYSENGNNYYLGFNQSNYRLVISSTPTTWNVDANGYYYTVDGFNYYIMCDNDSWFLKGWVELKYNNNILAFSTANGIYNVTSSSENTMWSLSNPAGQTLLTLVINGMTYYLSCERNENNELTGDLEAVTSISVATQWNKDENNNLSFAENGKTYYIVFVDNTWKIVAGGFAFTDGANHYLSVNNNKNGVMNTNSYANDYALWYITANTPSTYIFAQIDGANYYLGCNGNLTITSQPTTWYLDNGAYYTYYNDIKYYLHYENGWIAKVLDYTTIDDTNGNYLAINNSYSGVDNSLNANSNYNKWYLIEKNDGTVIAYPNGTDTYYLSIDLTTDSLVISNTPSLWQLDEDGYYQSNDDYNYHIVYDNGWKVSAYMNWITINSGTHYLALKSDKTGFTDASNGNTDYSRWHYTDDANQTSIYCLVGGNKYYLGVASENTFISDLSLNEYNWNIESNAIYTSNVTRANASFLTYDYNSWKVIKINTKYIKNNSSDAFLSIKASLDGIENRTTQATSTKWYFENVSGTGKICSLQNGKLYYLRYVMQNNIPTLTVTDNESLANTFVYTNYYQKNYAYKISGTNYYVTYDSEGWVNGTTGWICAELKFLISSGSTSNYLSANGTTLTNATTKSSATKWTFGNVPTGNTNIPSGTIRNDDGNYLYGNRTFNWGYVYNVLIGSTQGNWTINNNNRLRVLVNSGLLGDSYSYITFSSNKWQGSGSSGSELGFIPTINNIATGDNLTSANITLINGQFTHNDVIDGSINSNVHAEEAEIEKGTLANRSINIVLISKSEVEELTKTTIIFNRSFETQYTVSTFYFWEKVGTTSTNSGRSTYFPLKVDSDGNVDLTNTGYIVGGGYEQSTNTMGTNTSNDDKKIYSDIRISQYQMSNIYLSVDMRESSNFTFSDTYNAKLDVITKTYKSNGSYVRIKDNYNGSSIGTYASGMLSTYMTYDDLGLVQYDGLNKNGEKSQLKARYKLYRMLMDSGSLIYGLHFMDAQISKNHKITIDKAAINGELYYNFELPEDSIDFTIPQRGNIAFFAGTYFSGNNAFFSLHRIIRDPDNYSHITDIKEIKKVYGPTDLAKYQLTSDTRIDRAKTYYVKNNNNTFSKVTAPDVANLSTYYEEVDCPYIYLYSGDNNYYINDDKITGTPESRNYQLVFDLEWITSPTSIVNNAVYYFEIPVNEGEFALGSVPDKNGAYLIYLDIAANGGDSIFENTDTYGNDIVKTFITEFRSKTDNPNTVDHCLFQFSIEAPANAEGKFDINVTFDKSAASTNGEYDNGLYIITINNTSGENLLLVAYLCDDDFDISTPFPYAYQIVANGTVISNGTFNYWKSCETHVIPSS